MEYLYHPNTYDIIFLEEACYPYISCLYSFRGERLDSVSRPESNSYFSVDSHYIEEILVLITSVVMIEEKRFLCNAYIAKTSVLDTIEFSALPNARCWIKTTLELQLLQNLDDFVRKPFKKSEYNRLIILLQRCGNIIATLILRQGIERPSVWQRLILRPSVENPSIWQRLVVEANKANVPVESLESLGKQIQVYGEGSFKLIFHVQDDGSYVIQNFKEISEGTLETRIKEAICCLKTKGVPNIGQIRSIYKDDKDDELIGISMVRYSYTLKEYAFKTRNSITGEQKYWLIHDMIKGIMALHDAGFAHRDLSEVNMMVNSTTEKLLDGSFKPELVVIDFGKAEFINRDDILAWSVGEVTTSRLEILPLVRTVPDHGYKLYRSAATLPRTKNDHEVIQDPIDPCSEDVYAVGVLAWRIFSGQLPWGGILDTDLKKLRAIVSNPAYIKFYIERDVKGAKSRELLYKCITVTPQERSTARQLLDWLLQAKNELISEWVTSGRRIQ